MGAIRINDLPINRALDRQAMSSLRGGLGEGNWVFGWMVPYAPQSSSLLPVVNNFVQTNNYIGQVVNETQTIAISNTGANSNITAALIGSQGNTGSR
ncbi:hypothetical protein LZ012_19355 [Dechloromonas sp. XY25]|uniref:Uncharacterized protein n=1 Tax=Dechloromonas hankyongensis TaxID=2908002 RepID=A0ABS9K7L2_9RHOO|nr:hypothetical protein [Dechloromonas hankyongensis]MCG2579153.1 hypothetical protein [Dechloromonas hankyongensis]